MNNILEKICNDKKIEVDIQRKLISEKELQFKINVMEKPREFYNHINKNYVKNKLSIIAEIKKASPSKGIISKNFNPALTAKLYTSGKATCISVLTDKKYFKGKNEDLITVKKFSNAPVLRKDFIVSEYQILESRAIGADCILLIHGVLSTDTMKNFINIAQQLNMDVLIETHDYNELKYWIKTKNILLGINNRNLKNMKVNIEHSVNLKAKINNNRNIICESGITNSQDIDYLIKKKFRTFLIGEYLMKSENPDKLLESIFKKDKKQ